MDYSKMTVTELRAEAKKLGIKNVTTMKKADIEAALTAAAAVPEKTEKKPAKAEKPAPKKAKSETAQVKAKAAEKKSASEQKSETEEVSVKTENASAEDSKKNVKTTKPASDRRTGAGRKPAGNRAAGKAEDSKKSEAKSSEKKAAETKAAEIKAAEEKAAEAKAAEAKAAEEKAAAEKREAAEAARRAAMEAAKKLEEAARARAVVNEPQSSQGFRRPEKKEGGNSLGVTPEMEQLDSGDTKVGILEVMPDGFGFIRCDNYLPGEDDVYVSPAQIRRFNMKTGDIVAGNTRVKGQNEKFSALLYVKSINGIHPAEAAKRPKFEDLTPVFPYERLKLETPGCGPAMRIVDILSPIGKGQRGMIVSQPKAGKTTLLKQIAKAIIANHPEEHLIILLIDERPEEVTDMKECIKGENVDVIYSTFDELPENHKRVSEMVMERAKRLVEHKKDVIILLDSITRLARAYNLTCTASGRTLSGGLDPAALYMPKKFFGSARKMREGGSLTILATALVDTGSRMDDVVFEEFKGTGNMELVLDRSLSERRIFPAIDLPKSGTRRDDLLLERPEQEVNFMMRRAFNSAKSEECIEKIIAGFARTQSNAEFIRDMKGKKII